MRALQEYERKRNFKKTPEPGASVKKGKHKAPIFVVQEHHASHLHYDFRLEMDGVLKSWAVPKGPSMDPANKRLAVEVEDHPIPYAQFEGHIPEGEYGGGDVYIWDRGTWEPPEDPMESLKNGHIEFALKGKKLKGRWVLIRTRQSKGSKPQWLLMKKKDVEAISEPAEKTKSSAKAKSSKAKSSKTAKTSAVSKSRSSSRKKVSPANGLPEFIDVELARLVEAPPQGEGWIHETKYDGYRTEARIEKGDVQLLTRTAQDWTHKYPTVARALQKLKVEDAIFDGEIVWVDEKGRSDFQKLQNALKEKESSSIIYYVFDLIYLNGEDLRQLPLIERKKRLEKLLAPLKGTAVLFSEHLVGEAEQFLEAACDLQLEGIVSKRAESLYLSGRNDNWVKSKCKQRQEFVIGGFTEGEGSRIGFGALLLGVYEGEKLRYVGRVGTGFSHESLLSLQKKLKAREQKKSPFSLKSPKEKGQHWVKPELVAEIAFANWTEDEILRVPVFQGLREDKPAEQILRETTAPTVKITHPDKILFKKEKLSKQDVVDYYKTVSQWMIPHLSGRPLSIVRCPEGTSGECFYQKHSSSKLPDSIDTISIKEKTATREYMTVDSLEGVTALVQQGTIEFHGWNCRKLDVEHPDQFVLDFDPGPGVPWKNVVQGVFAMKKILDEAKIKSFVKVTGGKGVHIHVPLKPIYSWEDIKEFALTLSKELVSRQPKLFTVTPVKKEREGKIFIDYLRNNASATAVVPYSLRAKETSAVALPLEWDEIKDLKSANQWTVQKTLQKLEERGKDPWKDFLKFAQEVDL